MKISARNVYEGTVQAVREGTISAEVDVALGDGTVLVAGITEGSVHALGITPGETVLAIIKAPLVLLATDTDGWAYTARNQLAGRVVAIQKGAVNASVSVALPGGASIVSNITNSAVDDLALAVGSPVVALFKAGSVILAKRR